MANSNVDLNEKIRQAEENVAEWFKDGVPSGYTVQSWLTVCRTDFDENGKATTYQTTLHSPEDREAV